MCGMAPKHTCGGQRFYWKWVPKDHVMWHFPHKVASGVMEGIVKLLLNSREKTTAVLLWFLPVEREAILLERSGVTPVVVR